MQAAAAEGGVAAEGEGAAAPEGAQRRRCWWGGGVGGAAGGGNRSVRYVWRFVVYGLHEPRFDQRRSTAFAHKLVVEQAEPSCLHYLVRGVDEHFRP